MSAERRLKAIEESLSPTEIIAAWLEAVHAHGSLETAVQVLLDDPEGSPPLDQLVRAARSSATTRNRGKPLDERNNAIDQATKETIFRFRLVMRTITRTYELLDRQLLLDAAFSARLALQCADTPKRGPEHDHVGNLVELRDLIVARVDELIAAGEARAAVEVRYLGGHPALFPNRQAEWDERLEFSQRIGALAVGLAEKDGVSAPLPPAPEVTAARVARLAADLVEPARAEALEDIGQGWRAYKVASDWTRQQLGSRP